MRKTDTVAIGWIDGGTVDNRFCISMINLFTARNDRVKSILNSSGSLLARQRNEVVVAFLDANDCDWLFFIDTDETITPEAFDKLCDAAHQTLRPIVAGLYFAAWASDDMYPTPTPMIMRKNGSGRYNPVWEFPDDGVIPVDAAGTGALLIHRDVLMKMRQASGAGPLAQHEAGRWCWFRDLAVAGDWMGEDIYFCRRATDMGFPIHAATGCRLGHHKQYWLTDRQYSVPESS